MTGVGKALTFITANTNSFLLCQTLTTSVESKSLQLSMTYTTSDENTPDNIIQMEEQISMTVTVTLPEVA